MINHYLQFHAISLLVALPVYQDLVPMFLLHLINHRVTVIYLASVVGMEQLVCS